MPGAADSAPARPWLRRAGGALRRVSATALTAILVLAPLAEQPRACAFDMVKPEKTVIDWIVDSDVLVLARSRADNAFAYEIVEVLFGDPTDRDIGQLVDTATRRALAANPDDAVLFARDGDGGWRRVAHVDADFRALLAVAHPARAAWRGAMPQERIDLIARLQVDPRPARRQLAIAELDKVPYADLRRFDLRIPEEELLADLWTRSGYPYQAIRALLLGLHGTADARAAIVSFIESAETRPSADNLGAFAAALIEIDGVAGVERLQGGMLLDPAEPLDRIEQLVMALSVHHALAPRDLRDAITAALEALVAARPEAGVLVARQYTLRADWSQAALLEPLVAERRLGSLSDLLTVSVYVARAREADQDPGRGARDG